MVKSILLDERIDALNALIEIKIGDYLSFARKIIDNNEYQRRKVIKSKIKEILKADLQRNCLMPSIVLAVSNYDRAELQNERNYEDTGEIIKKATESNDIMIIDGLQRTFVLLELEDDLKKNNRTVELEKLYSHTIRAEVYLGLSRVGLLYRMITLNTGQTTMSTRHLMEILYFDYSRVGIEGIKLTTDKEDTFISDSIYDYNFKTILDGFNSYLEKDESLIDRTTILDNINTLEVLNKENDNKDIFKDFLITYKIFLEVLLFKTDGWSYDKSIVDDSLRLNANPFGKSILDIFKKSQAITGFGAGLGSLREDNGLDLIIVRELFEKINAEGDDWDYVIYQLLKHLDIIKEKSKKIGNDQRYYFRYFFKGLFDRENNSYLNFKKATEYAFDRTRKEKEYK
ncbi:hypothetical protein B0A81_09965 [Flavobacterium plurextorum]|uniref:Uncharacterized protein n=1 Tax=Flavobacterium plurextorum TaxID=1114867 RepID=A0ABX4CV58_9FLAO|nr:hypothetical protein [Flavobacterium plurextorum]OXB08619.1 hypothetical protein B0A81_09965 [Flavobacterium plurextorum]